MNRRADEEPRLQRSNCDAATFERCCVVWFLFSCWGVRAWAPRRCPSGRPKVVLPACRFWSITRLTSRGTPIRLTPRQLNQQCRWLVEHGYTSITLRQFWRAARGLADLPPNPVILTNDDGDPSARTFARILERYGLVGNYFVNNVSPLTRRQIRSLAQRGSVEAHTVSHVALSGLDYEDQVAEIAENRAYLEEITGQPVRFLAWPYGDVNESAIEAAAAAGIVMAFGLGATAADLDTTDWYAIPRMTIFVDDDLETFAAKVRGGERRMGCKQGRLSTGRKRGEQQGSLTAFMDQADNRNHALSLALECRLGSGILNSGRAGDRVEARSGVRRARRRPGQGRAPGRRGPPGRRGGCARRSPG